MYCKVWITAARLSIFEIFSYQHALIWTYRVRIIFLTTCFLSTIFYFFFLFSMVFISFFHYNCFNDAFCLMYFHSYSSVLFKKNETASKDCIHVNCFFEKFLPTRLLGPIRLLYFSIFPHLHGYLDSTVIWHLRVSTWTLDTIQDFLIT